MTPRIWARCCGVGLLAGAATLGLLVVFGVFEEPAPSTTTEPAAAEPAPTTSGTTFAPPSTSSPPVVQTLPLSPLAARLPAPESAEPRAVTAVRPIVLRIPDLSIEVGVRGVGVESDGQLEVPDETEAGWYRLGSAPGQPGATVIAAHVSWNDTRGPFFRLADLELGAEVEVVLEDGTGRRYSVIERAQYPKLGLPAERIWARDGDETLVLITCGGDFNRDIRRYRDNIVVYATPVDDGSP